MTSHPGRSGSRGSQNEDGSRSSFPNPEALAVPGGRGPATLSVVSSVPDTEGDGLAAGATGPVGEPGLPPSRPSTAATSRRGPPPSTSGGSRPPSSYSRTHVPSLTSSAFFRPMSSQRLQAQRGQRPNSNLGPRSIPSSQKKENTRPTDSSQGRNLAPQADHYDDRPVSRATEFTEVPDRTNRTDSPTGAETLRSAGGSEAPLAGDLSPQRQRPANLDLSRTFKSNDKTMQKSPRSPHSFRSSFMLGSRQSKQSAPRRQEGHEKLESDPPTPHTIPQAEKKEEVKRELGKNYEYFTGNTRFFFGGRAQNTRELPINIGTGLAMLIPAILFFVFSAADTWTLITPAIPILFAYVFLICFSSFVHASLSNPGILPRNLHPFPPTNPNEDPLTLGPPTTEWTMVVSATSPNAAMEVPTKYCKTCNIWRPPRCHHCRQCDNCVETQDHHCVWLNNCVGRRNYRQFFTFIASGTLLALMLFGFSLAQIFAVKNDRGGDFSFFDAVRETRGVPFAMVIYGILILVYPFALMVYHLGLVGSGQTTREYLQAHKFLKKDRHRPFTQGNPFKNWVAVLNRPRPPTYLHFKKEYEEGDQRYGDRRRGRGSPPQNGGVEMQSIGNTAQRMTPR